MEERRLRQVNILSLYYTDESRELAVIWPYNLQDFHEPGKGQFCNRTSISYRISFTLCTIDRFD